jgi:hypothetical protein
VNLPDYDEVTRLRLRLNEVELQRDAFAAALRKEVLAVIRETIIKEINAASEELSRQIKALAPKTIEATYVVSPEDAARIKAATKWVGGQP